MNRNAIEIETSETGLVAVVTKTWRDARIAMDRMDADGIACGHPSLRTDDPVDGYRVQTGTKDAEAVRASVLA